MGILSSFSAVTLSLFDANQLQTRSSFEFFFSFPLFSSSMVLMASNIVPAWNSRTSLARQQLAHGTSSRCCACWSCL